MLSRRKFFLPNETGVSLLEVLIASTVLAIVVYGSMSYIILNLHQRERAVASGASTSYAQAISDEMTTALPNSMVPLAMSTNGSVITQGQLQNVFNKTYGGAWNLSLILPNTLSSS